MGEFAKNFRDLIVFDSKCRQVVFIMKFVTPILPHTHIPTHPHTSSPSSRSGFNLVEISLALMVVAIGLLSVLSLFPAGLDQNVRSVGDTHAALFAGEVLNGLRAHAETNWDGIGNSITNLFVAADSTWNNPGELDPHLNNTIRTNVYRRQSNTNIVDHAFRYRLQITTNDKIKAATLQVWNGQFGSISNPIIFYTEFYKFE